MAARSRASNASTYSDANGQSILSAQQRGAGLRNWDDDAARLPPPVFFSRLFWLGDAGWDPDLLDTFLFQLLTVLCILGNAIVIGIETDHPNDVCCEVFENIFLSIFAAELWVRLTVLGPRRFFRVRDNSDLFWNLFDFVVVAAGIAHTLLVWFEIFQQRHLLGKNATLFRILRLLRILRVLRIIRIVRFLKQLYLLAYGFVEGTLAVFWVAVLTAFFLYMFSIILVRTYGRIDSHELLSTGVVEDDFDEEFFTSHFGNMRSSMFSLFELLCAPDPKSYRTVMFQFPLLCIFLVTFIVLGSFGLNGLIVALINESILEKNMARLEADRIEREHNRKVLQQRCRELFDDIDDGRNRILPREQLITCKDQIVELFESLGVNYRDHDLHQMFHVMDYGDTGMIERTDFVQGVVELCDQIRPMSIMELHFQLTKCTSRVGELDAKLAHIQRTVEEESTSAAMAYRSSSDLVAEVGRMVQENHLRMCSSSPKRLVAPSSWAPCEPTIPRSSERVLPLNVSTDNAAAKPAMLAPHVREALQRHSRSLVEDAARIEAFMDSSTDPEAVEEVLALVVKQQENNAEVISQLLNLPDMLS